MSDSNPRDSEEHPIPAEPVEPARARGKGERPKFAYGTSPGGVVTDADGGVVQLVRRAGTSEEERFNIGVQMLEEGKAAEARELFRSMAVAHPKEKRYRVRMHYAWGREHQAAGRLDEARLEYERALRIDPSFEAARRALRRARPGFFRRLFGKKK